MSNSVSGGQAAALSVLAALSFHGDALAQNSKLAADLRPPMRVMAGDTAIDVTTGHAAPYLIDWDGDGIRDLLVGEFGDGEFPASELPDALDPAWKQPGNFANGKIRIYRNVGSNAAPKFAGFEFLQAAGADATVPIT